MNLKLVKSVENIKKNTVKLYCPIRNELSLLPLFLEYHRNLGIGCFVFVDNDSIDGSLDFLLTQDDCIVYQTKDSFKRANYAINWINELMQLHSRDQWAIYLDCDEFLVYENCESVPLADFLRSYNYADHNSFYAIMIDMYSDKEFGVFDIKDRCSLINTLYIDTDYIFRKYPRRPFKKCSQKSNIEVLGGPRCRIYSSPTIQNKRDWFYYLVAGQVDRFIKYIPIYLMPLLSRIWPRTPLAQYKTPVNFISNEFNYDSNHGSNNTLKADYMLGILHLKFSDELAQKIDPIFSYNNNYRRGLERFRLNYNLKNLDSKSLLCSCSKIYRGSKTLAKHEIIGNEPSVVFTSNTAYFRTKMVP